MPATCKRVRQHTRPYRSDDTFYKIIWKQAQNVPNCSYFFTYFYFKPFSILSEKAFNGNSEPGKQRQASMHQRSPNQELIVTLLRQEDVTSYDGRALHRQRKM